MAWFNNQKTRNNIGAAAEIAFITGLIIVSLFAKSCEDKSALVGVRIKNPAILQKTGGLDQEAKEQLLAAFKQAVNEFHASGGKEAEIPVTLPERRPESMNHQSLPFPEASRK